MTKKMKAKAFDRKVFKRVLKYTRPYQWRFNGVIIFAVFLSVFAAIRPLDVHLRHVVAATLPQ